MVKLNQQSIELIEAEAEKFIKVHCRSEANDLKRHGTAKLEDLFIASIPLKPLSLLAWLDNAPKQDLDSYPNIYWEDNKKTRAVAALGSVCSFSNQCSRSNFSSIADIENLIKCHPQQERLLFLGGAGFYEDKEDDPDWKDFPQIAFHLPKLYILKNRDAYHLRVAIPYSQQSAHDLAQEAFKQIQLFYPDQLSEDSDSKAQLVSRKDTPDYTEWQKNLSAVLEQLKHSELAKVVLARKTTLETESQTEPYNVLAKLKQSSINNYSFLYAPDATQAFISVSPEMLFSLKGKSLTSKAIAGTGRRGLSNADDQRIAQNLLNCKKNRTEQAFVVNELHQKLSSITSDLEPLEAPQAFKLSNLQHLCTTLRGTLKDNVSLQEILATLHPTSAVCGEPKEQALQTIKTTEAFGRGWYAGPVGVISSEWSEFVVAIRSLLLKERELKLFAGAGVISASSPAAEWDELDAKLKTPLSVFNH